MHDVSSLNQQSLRSEDRTPGDGVRALALRTVIVHSLLLACAPVVQSLTTIDGAWIGGTLLLVLFILGPVIGIWLHGEGQRRIGSVLLAAFMPAAVYTHVRMLLSLLDEVSVSSGTGPAILGFEALIVLLIISSALGSLLSFALLRGVHAGTAHNERNTSL